jgi:hypothetical protein
MIDESALNDWARRSPQVFWTPWFTLPNDLCGLNKLDI